MRMKVLTCLGEIDAAAVSRVNSGPTATAKSSSDAVYMSVNRALETSPGAIHD